MALNSVVRLAGRPNGPIARGIARPKPPTRPPTRLKPSQWHGGFYHGELSGRVVVSSDQASLHPCSHCVKGMTSRNSVTGSFIDPRKLTRRLGVVTLSMVHKAMSSMFSALLRSMIRKAAVGFSLLRHIRLFLQSIHTERMASSDKTEPTAAGSKSQTPIVDNAAASTNNTSEKKSQSSTGSGTLNEAALGGESAERNAGQQLAADSDSEEEEEWNMSLM
ncbi:uncharacterized protein BT62DRAFT_1010650 [Guyanagaster necrorhizus]|uniref:Uncharacterized protein n=1 Tax=Guyanagaster necrorhizus TaxID=856835 RepID=A0A9P8ANX2_9AGAR|nr:uncharacterized protein BT62DRAFT_1010650 [Guyanagaster necrorhizus MCA 3950]KAG7442370.1 hypothetical protein BT62DRAFT_1010650 [Guyanagaster necrorhizus MCA 3950]